MCTANIDLYLFFVYFSSYLYKHLQIKKEKQINYNLIEKNPFFSKNTDLYKNGTDILKTTFVSFSCS